MLVYYFFFVAAVITASLIAQLPSKTFLLITLSLSIVTLYRTFKKPLGSADQSINSTANRLFFKSLYFCRQYPLARYLRVLSCFLISWSIALLHGHYLVSQQFDEALYARECVLSGWVTGLPSLSPTYSRFDAQVETLNCQGLLVPLSKVTLSLYRSKLQIRAGDKILATVKLKSPRSNYSQGAFDKQLWALTRGVNASGYIKRMIKIQKNNHWRHGIRDDLRHWIQRRDISEASKNTLQALILGDKSGINDNQWQQLRNTGTVHLLVVSGLHIGIMLAIGWWLSFMLTVLLNACNYPFASYVYPELGALSLSFAYVLLAGASLSTQRAWLMGFILIAGRWVGNHFSLWDRWWLALVMVLIWQPLSVMQSGLWLSFAAVASLICLQGYRTNSGSWVHIIRGQWLVWIALLPLLLLYFQQVSLLSPLINLVAITYISLLLSTVIFAITLAAFGFQLPLQVAAASIDYFWMLLTATQDQAEVFIINTQGFSIALLLIVITSCIYLILPLKRRVKLIVLLCWLILVYPPREKPLAQQTFKLTLIDVGQGLSVLIQTAEHSVLFDTGAAFKSTRALHSGFSYFNAVVKPLLAYQQINRLDLLVISHTDNDHSGGLNDVVKHLKVNRIDSELSVSSNQPTAKCLSNRLWNWDGIVFHYRQPNVSAFKKPNNRSCVLELGNATCRVLIMADAEYTIESQLLPSTIAAQDNVLIVGHHGSNTSTSALFLERETFSTALISSGYKNRYNHPHPKVLARLNTANIKVYRTDVRGSITLTSTPTGCTVKSYRDSHSRYWW